MPTIDHASIQAEAQKAAWLYDDLNTACPYPWGTQQANAFCTAFLTAKEQMQRDRDQQNKPATAP